MLTILWILGIIFFWEFIGSDKTKNKILYSVLLLIIILLYAIFPILRS